MRGVQPRATWRHLLRNWDTVVLGRTAMGAQLVETGRLEGGAKPPPPLGMPTLMVASEARKRPLRKWLGVPRAHRRTSDVRFGVATTERRAGKTVGQAVPEET